MQQLENSPPSAGCFSIIRRTGRHIRRRIGLLPSLAKLETKFAPKPPALPMPMASTGSRGSSPTTQRVVSPMSTDWCARPQRPACVPKLDLSWLDVDEAKNDAKPTFTKPNSPKAEGRPRHSHTHSHT